MSFGKPIGGVKGVLPDLNRFAVGLIVFGASLLPLDGAIVYFEPSEPVPVFGSWPPLTREIDINNNGIVDFIFESSNSQSGFNVQPQNGNRALAAVPNTSGAFPLNGGSFIGGIPDDNVYWREDQSILVSCLRITPPFDIGCGGLWAEQINPIGGHYEGVIAFLGVEFWEDDQVYYGWLEVDTETLGPIVNGGYINRWAYNSVPGEPIYAGQIPEPRTYALILGALVAGLVAMKRRLPLGRSVSQRRSGRN